jgi:hypothetical protein
MPPFETWERILSFAVAALSALLAASLWTRGLARLYPVFTFFLAYGALRSLIVATVKFSSTAYAYFFIITELVQMTLYVLMLLELYGLVFDKFPGIRAASRLALSVALGVSILLSAVSLAPEMAANEKRRNDNLKSSKNKQSVTPEKALPKSGQSKPQPSGQDRRWLLDLFMISERGILLSLVLMILAMSAFLGWYPIDLPRNVIVHSMVFAAFFVSKAIIILYRNIGHYQVGLEWRCAVMVVGVVCLLIWMGGLRKAGEMARVKVAPWNRENERELVAQLKGINAALGRLARE